MLTPEEVAGLLEEARDRRRAEVLRRFRRRPEPPSPASLADDLNAATTLLARFDRRPRRRVRGDRFLL